MTHKHFWLVWKSNKATRVGFSLFWQRKALRMCQIKFFAVYCCPNNLSCSSSTDKHQAGGVDQVGQVKDEINASEHSHGHTLIPNTQPRTAAAGRPLFNSTVLRVKLEYGPDNGSRQIEDHGQKSIGRQETGKREGETASALADTEHDDGCWQDKANAVDGHAVLQSIMIVIQYGVADEDKDDAGHKGLTHLQQTRGCGHVTRNFTWSCLADAHLGHVGNGGETGKDSWHYTVVSDFRWSPGTFEEVEGEDYGGGQAEEGSVAGERDWEILPGNRGSGLKAEELHQNNEQGPGKTEGPAEDAPVSSSMIEVPTVYRHRKGHTGEDQGCQPGPQEGAGVQNDGHDVRVLQPLRTGNGTVRGKDI